MESKDNIVMRFIIQIHTLRPVNDATEGSTQEAHMCASCVLPKKVGKIKHAGSMQEACRKHAGSMQEACRKHAGSTQVYSVSI